jgi:hypothetical protein
MSKTRVADLTWGPSGFGLRGLAMIRA